MPAHVLSNVLTRMRQLTPVTPPLKMVKPVGFCESEACLDLTEILFQERKQKCCNSIFVITIPCIDFPGTLAHTMECSVYFQ